MEGGGVGRGSEGKGRGGKEGGLVFGACATGCPRRLYVAIGVVVWYGSCTYCTVQRRPLRSGENVGWTTGRPT